VFRTAMADEGRPVCPARTGAPHRTASNCWCVSRQLKVPAASSSSSHQPIATSSASDRAAGGAASRQLGRVAPVGRGDAIKHRRSPVARLAACSPATASPWPGRRRKSRVFEGVVAADFNQLGRPSTHPHVAEWMPVRTIPFHRGVPPFRSRRVWACLKQLIWTLPCPLGAAQPWAGSP